MYFCKKQPGKISNILKKEHSFSTKRAQFTLLFLENIVSAGYISYMEKISVHQLKIQRAQNYLRHRLLLLPAGGALPGTRTMCAQSGVGRKIMEQALLEAENEGLLLRKNRSGFYKESAPKAQTDVLIYVNNSLNQLAPVGSAGTPSQIARSVLALQSMARAKNLNCGFYTNFDEMPKVPLPLFALSVTDREILTRAEKLYPRTVTISGLPGKLACIPPVELATRAGLEHLASLGHRAVGYLYFRRPDPGFRDRHLFEYYRFMAEQGFKVEPCYVVPYPDENSVVSGIRRMFECSRPPTAIFAQTVWLPTVYRVLKELKLNIPWQVSLLGLGETDFVERLHPFPAIVNESARLIAEKAWELMFDSTADNAEITLPLEILQGASLRKYRG